MKDSRSARVQARATSAEDHRTPTSDALAAAEHLAQRVKNRSAQIRRRFTERTDTSEGAPPPPLAYLQRGGRGGQVRTKLYLTMLWVGAAWPHDVTFPARAYAQLLGLRDPDVAGARRVLDAITWLEAHHFLEVENRPGHPSKVTLLEEGGDGSRYTVPGSEFEAIKNRETSNPLVQRHRYINLPPEFWTKGWISVLKGPAIAMLLVLFAQYNTKRAGEQEIWFSPKVADRLYDLSEDTRSSGLRELADAGLITIARRNTNPDPFAVRRTRNVYKFDPKSLEKPASVRIRTTRRTTVASPAKQKIVGRGAKAATKHISRPTSP